jgi:hypothetical protein
MICPRCRAPRVYASKSRTPVEKLLRKLVSSKRLYRCHLCDWRGWGRPSAYGKARALVGRLTVKREPLDIKSLDQHLD